jgi:hypothetical protein
MLDKGLIGMLAATAALLLAPCGAQAFDESKYPDLKGQWERVGAPRWVERGQKAPLTPEYQAINEAQLADQAAGGQGNWPSSFCIPQGMPAIMNLYDPMEIVVTQDTTYILISHINDSYRRIYTDGRDWPAEGQYEPSYAGYSIGKWVDTTRQRPLRRNSRWRPAISGPPGVPDPPACRCTATIRASSGAHYLDKADATSSTTTSRCTIMP